MPARRSLSPDRVVTVRATMAVPAATPRRRAATIPVDWQVADYECAVIGSCLPGIAQTLAADVACDPDLPAPESLFDRLPVAYRSE